MIAALSSLPPLMEFLGGLAMAGALWYGSRQITEGNLTTGEFSAFMAALFMMYGPAKKLSRVNANLQQAIAASERIFEMLDTHSEVKERPLEAEDVARRSSAPDYVIIVKEKLAAQHAVEQLIICALAQAPAVARVDELRCNAQPQRGVANASLQHITRAKLASAYFQKRWEPAPLRRKAA